MFLNRLYYTPLSLYLSRKYESRNDVLKTIIVDEH